MPEDSKGETRYGPATITCPYCLEEFEVEAGPTRRCEVTHCDDEKWIIVDLVDETAGKGSWLETDGGRVESESAVDQGPWTCPDCGADLDIQTVEFHVPEGPNRGLVGQANGHYCPECEEMVRFSRKVPTKEVPADG